MKWVPLPEKSPPGWKGTVKAMKRDQASGKMPKGVNPFALAWSMHKKGAKPHYSNRAPFKKKHEGLADLVADPVAETADAEATLKKLEQQMARTKKPGARADLARRIGAIRFALAQRGKTTEADQSDIRTRLVALFTSSPGVSYTGSAAAQAIGVPEGDVRSALAKLTNAGLLRFERGEGYSLNTEGTKGQLRIPSDLKPAAGLTSLDFRIGSRTTTLRTPKRAFECLALFEPGKSLSLAQVAEGLASTRAEALALVAPLVEGGALRYDASGYSCPDVDAAIVVAEGYQHVHWKGAQSLRFKITTAKGSKTVQGRSFGKYIGIHADNKAHYKDAWVVTHMPTGLRLGAVSNDQLAVQVAKSLEAQLGDALNFTDTAAVPEEVKTAIMNARARLKNESVEEAVAPEIGKNDAGFYVVRPSGLKDTFKTLEKLRYALSQMLGSMQKASAAITRAGLSEGVLAENFPVKDALEFLRSKSEFKHVKWEKGAADLSHVLVFRDEDVSRDAFMALKGKFGAKLNARRNGEAIDFYESVTEAVEEWEKVEGWTVAHEGNSVLLFDPEGTEWEVDQMEASPADGDDVHLLAYNVSEGGDEDETITHEDVPHAVRIALRDMAEELVVNAYPEPEESLVFEMSATPPMAVRALEKLIAQYEQRAAEEPDSVAADDLADYKRLLALLKTQSWKAAHKLVNDLDTAARDALPDAVFFLPELGFEESVDEETRKEWAARQPKAQVLPGSEKAHAKFVASKSKGKTEGKGHWRTTKGGHKIYIEGGKITKGNPHVVGKAQPAKDPEHEKLDAAVKGAKGLSDDDRASVEFFSDAFKSGDKKRLASAMRSMGSIARDVVPGSVWRKAGGISHKRESIDVDAFLDGQPNPGLALLALADVTTSGNAGGFSRGGPGGGQPLCSPFTLKGESKKPRNLGRTGSIKAVQAESLDEMAKLSARGRKELLRLSKQTPPPEDSKDRIEWYKHTRAYMDDGHVLTKMDARYAPDPAGYGRSVKGYLHTWGWKDGGKLKKELLNRAGLEQVRAKYVGQGWTVEEDNTATLDEAVAPFPVWVHPPDPEGDAFAAQFLAPAIARAARLPKSTLVCPACEGERAYWHEAHPDTGMDEMVVRCPDCKEDTEGDPTPVTLLGEGKIRIPHWRTLVDELMDLAKEIDDGEVEILLHVDSKGWNVHRRGKEPEGKLGLWAEGSIDAGLTPEDAKETAQDMIEQLRALSRYLDVKGESVDEDWRTPALLHQPAKNYDEAQEHGYTDRSSDAEARCGNCSFGAAVGPKTACRMFKFWAATKGSCDEWEAQGTTESSKAPAGNAAVVLLRLRQHGVSQRVEQLVRKHSGRMGAGANYVLPVHFDKDDDRTAFLASIKRQNQEESLEERTYRVTNKLPDGTYSSEFDATGSAAAKAGVRDALAKRKVGKVKVEVWSDVEDDETGKPRGWMRVLSLEPNESVDPTTVVETDEGESTFGALKVGDTFRMPDDPANAVLKKTGPASYKVLSADDEFARGLTIRSVKASEPVLPESVEEAVDVTAARQYVKRIKNEKKRAYAEAWLAHLLGKGSKPDSSMSATGLSYMAAQAVRLELDKLLTGEDMPSDVTIGEATLEPLKPATVTRGPNAFVITFREAAFLASPRHYWTGSVWSAEDGEAKVYGTRKDANADLPRAKKTATPYIEALTLSNESELPDLPREDDDLECAVDESLVVLGGLAIATLVGAPLAKGVIAAVRAVKALLDAGKKTAAEKTWDKISRGDRAKVVAWAKKQKARTSESVRIPADRVEAFLAEASRLDVPEDVPATFSPEGDLLVTLDADKATAVRGALELAGVQ